MIYISELEIIDFQTHKKTTIEFSPNFNVIVGSTRSGKSSLVRALDFLLYNNWYEDYQRFGANKAIIKAKLSNGKVLVREKGTKTNKISIKDVSGEQRFESFGTSLPVEVTAALGISPIDIGAKEPICANVANQDDPLFLLYETGTDKTKILSRLSGLHWIDYALRDLNLDRRTQSTEIQFLSDTNVKLLDSLRKFNRIDVLKKQLDIEKERLAKIKKVVALLKEGKNLSAKAVQWKKDYQEMQALKTVNFPAEIAKLERLIHIQADVLQPLLDRSKRLNTIDLSIKNTQAYLITLRNSQNLLEKQIEEESSKIPVCPECGQEIKQKVHHE